MRYIAGLLLLSGNLAAQEPALARGRLLETDTGASGELSIRTTANRVFWYVYDAKTYVEREKRPTTAARLQKGDILEIVSDTGPDAALRYARTIHVVESPVENPRRMPLSLGRYALPRAAPARENPLRQDLLFLRGTLAFSGLICRLNDERFVLRTRSDGEKTVYLRPDTRYLEAGRIVGPPELKLNTRVFVRGSKNIDGELEAFQVIWGEILEPGALR